MKEVFNILIRFKSYFKKYINQFILAIIGMILASVGTAVSAYLVKPVLDKIFVEKNIDLLYLLPYAIIAIYFIKSLGTYMQAYFTAYIGQDMIKNFRQKVVANLINLDMAFFNKFRTGELISRSTNDIERIRAVVSSMIPELIREFVTIIGLLCIVIYQSSFLAFFALIVLPAAAYPLSKLAKKMKKISRQSQEKNSDISSNLSEIFTNIELIKANNAQEKELYKFSQNNNKIFKINMKSVKISQLISPMMETIGSVGIAVVIIFGGKEVIEGHMSVGSFFSFLTALFMLYTPVKRISSLYNSMQDAVVASQRTFELLDKTSNIKEGNLEFPKQIKRISLQDIYFGYGEKTILNGVDFNVKMGELMALVGSSGGGKTSIINLIMRFYDPNSGSILIDENDISEFKINSLRENIGLVTQRIYIFNDTIANNIAYSGEFDENRVLQALKLANAYEFVSNLDQGIYTTLDEFGTNLSGGQRQRIAIARALYKNPQILIFDEATSALDNESEREIAKAIENLRHDRIIIVIAHRLTTIENADKIAVLDGGKIVGFGDDKKLMKECKIYQKLKNSSLV